MSRFEEIGCEIQYSAYSKSNAEKFFEKSCSLCCNSGLRINCDRCAIAFAHKIVTEAFDSSAAKFAVG